MNNLNDIVNLTSESMAEAAARDLLAIRTAGDPDGGFTMPDIVWLLVRTVATGRQIGRLILDADELADARRKLNRFLDIAIAGGWRGIDLLETLMAKGVASDRLEALARKAGRYCDNRPDLLDELLEEAFGTEAPKKVRRITTNAPLPEVLHQTLPKVVLRRSMDEHFQRKVEIDGEERICMSPEAILLMAAKMGYDPEETGDCGVGEPAALRIVDSVFNAATTAGYSRVEALRQMLTDGPHGCETMAAIEHLTGECGTEVIVRGMRAAGLNLQGG